MAITNDPSTWPSGDPIWSIAQAIAQAEGYNVTTALPFRLNNPGDLTKGDEWGQPVIGYVTNPSGANLINFASPEAGWNALHAKLSNIANGTSRVYSPSMSWQQIGAIWAAGATIWGTNVASILGVDPTDTFADYIAESGGGAQSASAAQP